MDCNGFDAIIGAFRSATIEAMLRLSHFRRVKFQAFQVSARLRAKTSKEPEMESDLQVDPA